MRKAHFEFGFTVRWAGYTYSEMSSTDFDFETAYDSKRNSRADFDFEMGVLLIAR